MASLTVDRGLEIEARHHAKQAGRDRSALSMIALRANFVMADAVLSYSPTSDRFWGGFTVGSVQLLEPARSLLPVGTKSTCPVGRFRQS